MHGPFRRSMQSASFENAGVNSDTADDVLQRFDAVIACHPRDVIILAGTSYERMIDNLTEAGATDGPAFAGDWRIGACSLS